VAAGFYTLISVIFSLILTELIDREYISKVMELTEQKLYEQGMPDAIIGSSMGLAEKFAKPPVSSILGFFSGMVISAIIAVVTSAFIQRKNPNTNNPFE